MSYEFRVKIAFQKKKKMIGILGHIVCVVLPYNEIVYIKNSGWSGGAMVLGKLLAPGRPVVVVLLFYVHGKHLRSCRDGQLT